MVHLWPRVVVVRSTTHAAAVMVKILSQTETRVKVTRKRKSLRCLTGYGAQLQRTSHDRGRSGVISLPALPAESERAEEPLRPTQRELLQGNG